MIIKRMNKTFTYCYIYIYISIKIRKYSYLCHRYKISCIFAADCIKRKVRNDN